MSYAIDELWGIHVCRYCRSYIDGDFHLGSLMHGFAIATSFQLHRNGTTLCKPPLLRCSDSGLSTKGHHGSVLFVPTIDANAVFDGYNRRTLSWNWDRIIPFLMPRFSSALLPALILFSIMAYQSPDRILGRNCNNRMNQQAVCSLERGCGFANKRNIRFREY